MDQRLFSTGAAARAGPTPAPATFRATVGVRPALRITLAPIAAILLIAALARLYHVDQPLTDVFSWRESSTAMMADNFYHRGWNILYPEVSWDGPGPSYQGRELQTVSY